MKKLFFVLFLTLSAVAVVSCQDQKQDASEDKLQSIAQNPAYKSYLASIREVQLGIARGEFDLGNIMPVIVKNPSLPICDIPAEELKGIAGGHRYQELNCNMERETEKLKKILPDFFKLNQEQVFKVSKLHDANEGIKWEKNIIEALKKRN